MLLALSVGCDPPAPGPTGTTAAPTSAASSKTTPASTKASQQKRDDTIRFRDKKVWVGDKEVHDGELLQRGGKLDDIPPLRFAIEDARSAAGTRRDGPYTVVFEDEPSKWVWQSVLFSLAHRGEKSDVTIQRGSKKVTASLVAIPEWDKGWIHVWGAKVDTISLRASEKAARGYRLEPDLG